MSDIEGPSSVRRRRIVAEEPGESGARDLPLVVTPDATGRDLIQLLRNDHHKVRSQLHAAGAILFRGFEIEGAEHLGMAMAALTTSGALPYRERSSPRTEVLENVYTATDHPSAESIILHSEQSYAARWPLLIAFACLQPAAHGGATPLASTRRILANIPDSIVHRVEEQGYLLIRRYGAGRGLSWQVAFQTLSQDEVGRYCRSSGIEYDFRPNGSLETRQRCRATRLHPVTRERVWFNHLAFFHESALDPETRSVLRRESGGLPFETKYGDGSAISDEEVASIRAVVDAETTRFEWEGGDFLLLDNMLVQHGRDPFEPPRDVVVVMGESIDGTETGDGDLSVRDFHTPNA